MAVNKKSVKKVEKLFKNEWDEIVPAVKQLAGILKSLKVKNAKKEFRDYVLKKHG